MTTRWYGRREGVPYSERSRSASDRMPTAHSQPTHSTGAVPMCSPGTPSRPGSGLIVSTTYGASISFFYEPCLDRDVPRGRGVDRPPRCGVSPQISPDLQA